MNPQIKSVVPQSDYKLLLTFENGELKLFDMKPYINRSTFFKQLENEQYFKTVRVSLGSIQWANGQDLSLDTLYIKGEPLDSLYNSYQTISPIPNDETLEAMRDVETGKNYEDVALEDSKNINLTPITQP